MVAHQVLGRAGGAEATRHLFRAVEWADRLHGRLAATADRSAFLRLRGDVYLDLVAALLDRGRPRDRRRALDILSRFRSGWLVDELARRADRGDDPELRRWQELRTRLAALLRQVEGQDEPRVRRLGMTIHNELRSLEEELRSSELVLARRRPGLFSQERRQSVSEALLERLPEGHVFVEYFLDRRDLLTFVATRGALQVSRSPVADEVRELVASVRFHMDTNTWRTAGSAGASVAAMRDRLQRLGSVLLSPLPADEWRVLWAAPHAELFHIPWAALESPAGEALIDRARFSLTPGAGVVAGLLQEAPGKPATVGLCGVASEDLPMVGRELEALASLDATASVVEAASRQDFLDMLATHDVVHLAGHAVFLDGLPGASGLRLADGYITVHDLAATRMRASLVSFGVCSGVRMGDRTDQRYEGFLRALLAGGVRTVVGAISPVRDEVAYDFDLEFFRLLEERSDPGAAYRGAVGELRRRDPHPATWGNFHLYGDQRSWRIA
jgi:CHAT domain-containing protein